MKQLCTFACFFVVLLIVFLVHTDSNLWVVYPDRMLLKHRATPLEHLGWSSFLSATYSLFGLGLSALICWARRRFKGAERSAPPNGGPAEPSASSQAAGGPPSLTLSLIVT